MVATASPAAQRGAASTSAALNAAYGPSTLRAPSCVRAAELATSKPPLSSEGRRSAAAAPAAAAQNSLALQNTLAAHSTPTCRQSPTKRAPTAGSGNASRRSLASSHSRASQVTASSSSACLEGRRTAGSASGASQKAALGKAAAAKRLAELARVQQLLREQDETQHQLVVETQQLRVQQAQLKALLIKTSAETAAKPDTSHRLEKVIEQHKVELRALQVKITEREAKLSVQAEAAKAGVKERKHAPEQANEREALERALGQLEGRLEHNMKKMDEFRGKSIQLRRLIDEARSRRNLENERIDELRADIEHRREKRSTLTALAVEHAEATAEAEAQLEEMRKIASVERAAFERKQAAMTMQLKDAKLVLSTSVGDTAVELPTGADVRPLKRSLSRLSFQQQLEEERHKRAELSKRRSSIKYRSVRDSMQFISEKEKLHVIRETAQAQQQGWNDLCARTGVSDPEEVITHMLETESEATRLWHKHRALESEYKAESERLARVRAELERMKSERRKTELAAKHRVSELHERTSVSEKEIAKLRRQISSVQGSLDAAAQELAALMLKLRADKTLSYLEVPQPIAFFENHVLPGCSIVSSADQDSHAPRIIHSASQSEHPHIEDKSRWIASAVSALTAC
ncbi:hypothetical protein AB1Y20_022325 [Prymnesium parvum]|uniref:Uncharacterized protein n=1 Tax=Prymnesium parvum TaxID=97485 RepID=A0AB34JGR4_PRYPA